MRREFPKRLRVEIVNRAMQLSGRIVCEGCGLVLAAKRYEIDHVIPEALVIDKARALTAADGQLLGVECCHRGGRNKTAADVGQIAKAKRQRAVHIGAKRAKGFWKPPGARYDWRARRYYTKESV